MISDEIRKWNDAAGSQVKPNDMVVYRWFDYRGIRELYNLLSY